MMGLMMDRPLITTEILKHAVRNFHKTEVVTRTVEGPIHRYTIGDANLRIQKLANALQAMGVKAGDRVGVVGWNTYRQFELYYAVGGIGAVLHTHSTSSTVLSMAIRRDIRIDGYEMLKAFPGIDTHETTVDVRNYPNDQDMEALAREVEADYSAARFTVPGFLISGHGLYAWGADVDAARRHVEAFEFLLECELRTRQLEAK